MFRLSSLCVATLLAALTGCATESDTVKLRTSRVSTVMPDRGVRLDLLNLRLRVGDLENELAAKEQQITELTEMLVESELSRTNHLVPAADSVLVLDNE